jgi:uncharacterized membrane protein
MHTQQNVHGISHWFSDANTCCWLYTRFFGANIVDHQVAVVNLQLFIIFNFLIQLRYHGEEEQEKAQCRRRIEEGEQTKPQK